MEHKIIIRHDRCVKPSSMLRMRSLLRSAVISALDNEAVNVPCELNILVTDDDGIKKINRAMRKMDKPTDVLSFPMYEFIPGAFKADKKLLDPQTGMLPLGDMVLSYDKIRSQALEYKHSTEREIAYLAVHSVLHLLGYDHPDDSEEKRSMRSREDEIMKKLELTR